MVLTGFVDDIREMDEIFIDGLWDINRPGQLPTTPRGIYQSWCRYTNLLYITLLLGPLFDQGVHSSSDFPINKAIKLDNLNGPS